MSVRRREEDTPPPKRLTPLFLAALVILLDQLTKTLAEAFLSPQTSLPILQNFFHLTLVRNQGVAFGLFHEFEKVLLVIITLSIGVLVVVGLRSGVSPWKVQVGTGLILGGAVGNWIDRIHYGAVIAFLDFRIWPVFNLADTAITVGVGLMFIQGLKDHAS